MRIVIISFAYAPSVGGIESVSAMLAKSLTDAGHEVRVLTSTLGPSQDGVARQPAVGELLRTLRWADAIFQSHAGLRLSWPLVTRLVQRPWIVVLHTSIYGYGWKQRVLGAIKRMLLPRGRTFAVSAYLARSVGANVRVMPNPYASDEFIPGIARRDATEMLFVGRLVPAKGLAVAIRALADTVEDVTLNVIGDGSRRAEYEELSIELGVGDRVNFLGSQPRVSVARAMREHQIIIVPSRSRLVEAFGMVAIEAIASGAVVIASRSGGLPEAVGDCGVLFDVDDSEQLAGRMDELVRADLSKYLTGADAHLAPYRPENVVRAYLQAVGVQEPAEQT